MANTISISAENDALKRSTIDRSLRHPVMFFFTSGAAWLAVSILFGLISVTKTWAPEFLDGFGFLNVGRLQTAHINTLIYGWGCQAAFGVMIWLMARLSRQECRASGTILTAGHIWNLAVMVGTIFILAGRGNGAHWMQFPSGVWPVLLACYVVIMIWSVIQFRVRDGGHVYISQWYLLAALFWFPWVFLSAHLLIFVFPGEGLMGAAINSWFRSALTYLFFVPVAIASAYYLAPKVSGRPVYSYSLAILGFWALAIIMPWAGMQKLTGAPIPVWLATWGAAATILFLIPALTVGVNILKTVPFGSATMAQSPSLRFSTAGVVALVVMGVVGLISNTTSGLKLTQFTMANYGYDILALYGVFTLSMFGAIYFIVPRLTGREWLSGRLIGLHFWFSIYGIISIVVFGIFGGFMQGIGQEDYTSSADRSYPYMMAMTICWGFVGISNVFFFLHLLLMWLRLGRRSSHPTLLTSHGSASPHGPEGALDDIEPSNA